MRELLHELTAALKSGRPCVYCAVVETRGSTRSEALRDLGELIEAAHVAFHANHFLKAHHVGRELRDAVSNQLAPLLPRAQTVPHVEGRHAQGHFGTIAPCPWRNCKVLSAALGCCSSLVLAAILRARRRPLSSTSSTCPRRPPSMRWAKPR